MARAGDAIDEPIKYPPTHRHATPVYEGGRHVGYVYKMGTGDRAWWAEYNRERLTPTPYKTRAAAVDQVQRNERMRSGRGLICFPPMTSPVALGAAPAPAPAPAPPPPPPPPPRPGL